MKVRTKEEETAHYRATLKGGGIGTGLGLIIGTTGVLLASRRYTIIRNLTIPMKAFLVTSSSTFFGVMAADNASRSFDGLESGRAQESLWFESREQRQKREELERMSTKDRIIMFAREEKYKIVTATWIASMFGAFYVVSRNPTLTGQQKIVQARVYAQGLTVGVLCATAGLEIADRRKGKSILDNVRKSPAEERERDAGPADIWKDMVAAEESRIKQKHQSLYAKPHGETAVVSAEEVEEQPASDEVEDGEKEAVAA